MQSMHPTTLYCDVSQFLSLSISISPNRSRQHGRLFFNSTVTFVINIMLYPLTPGTWHVIAAKVWALFSQIMAFCLRHHIITPFNGDSIWLGHPLHISLNCWIQNQNKLLKTMHLKMSPLTCRPFCAGVGLDAVPRPHHQLKQLSFKLKYITLTMMHKADVLLRKLIANFYST